jgi:hypothetical protein
MNQDIIKWAQQWGDWNGQTVEFNDVGLERFAALVAAAAKEEMLMAGNDQWLEEARKAEREACAKVCDEMPLRKFPARPSDCAVAIRARGQA